MTSKAKPKLEEVLFDNCCCSSEQSHHKEIHKECSCDDTDCPFNKLTEKTVENVFLDDLTGIYYPGFIKFFNSNSKDCMSQASKNAQKSFEARVQANKLFGKKKHTVDSHEEMWKLYSKSVAFAPVDSKELVLAYEARSNLFLHFKKYEECIKDIDRALAITTFDLLKVKLLCRKMTCFAATNKETNERENLWLSIKSCFEKVDGALKDEKFLKIVKQARTDACSLVDNQNRNEEKDSDQDRFFSVSQSDVTNPYVEKRLIQAKRDFEAGEVVAVTKPLIASINPDQFYVYCSHCYSFMWAGIPCEECALCMYCTEECRVEAWNKYHILECKILPHINFDHTYFHNFQITLKVFFMGFREFGSIAKLKEVAQDIDKLKEGSKVIKSHELSESGFFRYYMLPNTIQYGFCALTKFTKHTCFLLAYLTQTCNVFGKDMRSMKGNDLARNKEFVSFGLLLLKIYTSCISYSNVLSNSQLAEPKSTTIKDEKEPQNRSRYPIGQIFDPFAGLLKTSCSPNVATCYTDSGKIVYFCAQPIKKNDEITICSHTEFYKTESNVRFFDVMATMAIICKCKPCNNNWPHMEKMYNRFQQRTSKTETNVSRIVKKYIEMNEMKIDKVLAKNCNFNENEFQDLVKDVNAVFKVCGQPSFASSLMIWFLCMAFVKLHGLNWIKYIIPKDC